MKLKITLKQFANWLKKAFRIRSFILWLLKNFFLANNLQHVYSQIFILLKIYLTLPVTSAGAERSFSVLKRLKTYLRSTLGQERLSSLAILDIEYEQTGLLVENSLDDLVDDFATVKERRMNSVCFFQVFLCLKRVSLFVKMNRH